MLPGYFENKARGHMKVSSPVVLYPKACPQSGMTEYKNSQEHSALRTPSDSEIPLKENPQSQLERGAE
jgi:hypothetical protein